MKRAELGPAGIPRKRIVGEGCPGPHGCPGRSAFHSGASHPRVASHHRINSLRPWVPHPLPEAPAPLPMSFMPPPCSHKACLSQLFLRTLFLSGWLSPQPGTPLSPGPGPGFHSSPHRPPSRAFPGPEDGATFSAFTGARKAPAPAVWASPPLPGPGPPSTSPGPLPHLPNRS